MLLGCSKGSDTKGSDTKGADTKGPLTIVLKHAKILGPVDPIPALLAEFESAHPGIRIKAEVLPWTSDEQRQFLVINLEGGQPGFDLMMLDCIWVPEFARAGWILDLSAAGVTPDELAAYFPSAVEAGTYRLVFHPPSPFFTRVELQLELGDGDHHVPLLVSPYSCATYRGS